MGLPRYLATTQGFQYGMVATKITLHGTFVAVSVWRIIDYIPTDPCVGLESQDYARHATRMPLVQKHSITPDGAELDSDCLCHPL